MSKKRVQSFDIGIKHMSYCILEVAEDGQIQIIDWKVLNLLSPTTTGEQTEEQRPIKCSCSNSTKSKKVCSKNAKYTKNGNFYCQIHSNGQQYMIPEKRFQRSQLKKMNMAALHELVESFQVPLPPSLNSVIHRTTLIDTLTTFFQEKCFELIIPPKKAPSAATIDLITIGRNMKTQLDEIQNPFLENLTDVIMENQISPIAGRMKTIQGMLMQYYIVRYPNTMIAFISSANKLKPFRNQNPNSNPNPNPTENKTYREHKESAIEITRKLLDETPSFQSWKRFFEEAKTKKDDLADSLLQGLWFIKNKKSQ
jgi:hypothetical protein